MKFIVLSRSVNMINPQGWRNSETGPTCGVDTFEDTQAKLLRLCANHKQQFQNTDNLVALCVWHKLHADIEKPWGDNESERLLQWQWPHSDYISWEAKIVKVRDD